MKIFRTFFLFGTGGLIYNAIEIMWRGHTDHTMFVIGGLCFWIAGLLNESTEWDAPIWKQILTATGCITVIEFASGCFLNILLGYKVWDYSDMPMNLLGQICVPYILLWIPLSAIAIVLDDFIRWIFFQEEKPRYRWR